MTDLDEVYAMGYAEYLFRMEMYQLAMQDQTERMLFQAWLTSRLSVAQKKDGKYVFKNFDEFKKVIQNEKRPTNQKFDELRRVAGIVKAQQKGGY